MRSAWNLSTQNAVDLTKLQHEVLFGLETSSSINNHEVDAMLKGVFGAIISNGSWVAIFGTGDDWAFESFGPNLELLHRAGTERITGNEHYFLAHFLISSSEFSDTCSLSDAINADDKKNGWSFRGEVDFVFNRLSTRSIRDEHLIDHHLIDLLRIFDAFFLRLIEQFLD